MFETLLSLLANAQIDQSTKVPIVDNMFSFLSDPSHLKLASAWLESGSIFEDEHDKKELFKLSKNHQHQILFKICEEPSIPEQTKTDLLAKTLGDDKSDIA